MGIPIVIGICENELLRDLTFLKEFASDRVSLKMTPLLSGGLTARSIRILERELAGLEQSGLRAAAILIHADADRRDFRAVRKEVARTYEGSALSAGGLPLILCVPQPCTERWLCCGASPVRRARKATPKKGCDPWKRAWERGKGNDLDRVRNVASSARERLREIDDFAAFRGDWASAGLLQAPSRLDRRDR